MIIFRLYYYYITIYKYSESESDGCLIYKIKLCEKTYLAEVRLYFDSKPKETIYVSYQTMMILFKVYLFKCFI